MLHPGADPRGIAPDDDDNRRAESGKRIDQPVEKCLSAKFEQGLRRSHALRFTGGQNQSGDAHFSRALESSAKIDIDSDFQADFGLRRTAIISAATEIAISSGEMAPISRPIGA